MVRPMTHEEYSQFIHDISRIQSSLNLDCQTFPCELIDYAEHAEDFAFISPVLDKVIGPNVTFVETDTGCVVQTEPPAFRLFLRHLKRRWANAPQELLLNHLSHAVISCTHGQH